MTRRRRQDVHRRPVVLGVALVAPVILAGGLLAGELSGYERAGMRREMRVAADGGDVVVEAVLLPAPARADRRYERVVPAPVRGHSRSQVEAARVPEVMAVSSVPDLGVVGRSSRGGRTAPVGVDAMSPGVAERRSSGEAVEGAAGAQEEECPGEWVDTWLWEVCREREQERAVAEMSADGLTGDEG
ncbi:MULTISPECIES: hypothetical protein [unclassified Nonomuraea]|uniref:hypothetical protein n=1 Tax=unclassified Nonomuraea TaxID=2593643 RepID=UPI0034013E5F